MVTVGDIVGGGFRLVRERLGSVVVWAVLYLAINVGTIYAIRPTMQTMMAAHRLEVPRPTRPRWSARWAACSAFIA